MSDSKSTNDSHEPPRVFLSYAHETPAHIEWVKTLAKDMRSRGVDAILDQWRVPIGGDFTLFMDSIRACDRVLLICTPTYGQKSNEGAGGVGYERQIITAELAKSIKNAKFACVIRSGSSEESIPTFARTRRYVDFRNDADYAVRLEELLRDLLGAPKEPEPPIGPNPFLSPAAAPSAPASAVPTLDGEMDLSIDLGDGVALELIRVPAGEFMMGSPESEADRSNDEGPQHRIRIATAFYLGKYPVTQAQWRGVMRTNNSSFEGDDHPVENVSWNDSQDFCRTLSEKAGREVRLPTEAEWEYACRAGTTTPFYFGEGISTDQANYDGNYPYAGGKKGVYRKETTPVTNFAANGFGLFGMHGNVWEWCEDIWHDDYEGAPSDGRAWTSGGDSNSRVLRGGSWNYYGQDLRSAYRDGDGPVNRDDDVGFRVSAGT